LGLLLCFGFALSHLCSSMYYTLVHFYRGFLTRRQYAFSSSMSGDPESRGEMKGKAYVSEELGGQRAWLTLALSWGHG
jgi:hypothetical protein